MARTTSNPAGVVGRFLFAPADPTPLGFMRIITGLLVLYSTFAYSFDLKWLMGPDAWWNQDFANQSRREAPYILFPLGWETFEPSVRLEDAPHRRGEVLDFMRSLPDSAAERKYKLRYLAWLVGRPYDEQQAAILLPNSVAKVSTDAQRLEVEAALTAVNPTLVASPVTFPPFILRLTVAERLDLWPALTAFSDLLPAEPERLEYVLAWLSYYPADSRKDLVRFLGGDYVGPDGVQYGLPENPEIRGELLRYMEQWGVDPRQHPVKCTPTFSAFFHLTAPAGMWAFHLAAMGLAVLFTIGLYTRVTSVLLYLTSLSYIHRSIHHMFGQDTMQTILLLYLMLSPCGAAFSVDALRKRYRASRAILAAGGKPVPWAETALAGPQPSWQANFFLRLFQMHYCMIYLASGASKLKGNAWWNHNATWLTMVNPDFGLVTYSPYENLMHGIADHHVLAMVMCGVGVFFTIGLEVGFTFLVWTRARPVMLIWALLFHTGIAVMMGLSVFGLYMFALLLCYFPAALIRERVGVAAGDGRRMAVRYDGKVPGQARRVAMLRALDVAGQISFADAPGAPAVTLTDPAGRQISGNSVVGASLKHLALTRSFGWLVGPGNGAGDTGTPATLGVSAAVALAGAAVMAVGFMGLTVAYGTSEGVRPGLFVVLLCMAGVLAGAGLALFGVRQIVNRGAV